MSAKVKCPRCGKQKPRSEFPPKRIKVDSRCKDCYRKRKRELYHAHKEERREKAREIARKSYWKYVDVTREKLRKRAKRTRKRDPLGSLLRGAKAAAKTKGFKFNLTRDDLDLPSHCPVFGTKLKPQKRGSKRFGDAPSVDRIDSTRGYTRGNCVIISRHANCVKSYGTAEDHERIAKWMRENGQK